MRIIAGLGKLQGAQGAVSALIPEKHLELQSYNFAG
jgi:hypothetical protein